MRKHPAGRASAEESLPPVAQVLSLGLCALAGAAFVLRQGSTPARAAGPAGLLQDPANTAQGPAERLIQPPARAQRPG